MSIYKNGIWKHSGSPNKNYILNSTFAGKTDSGIYTFNKDVVTFESDALQASGYSFNLSMDQTAKTDFRNKKITFSMEYKIDTALTFGTTNPWVGFEMTVTRNTTTGGSSQWLDWYGGKSIPTAVTNDWVYYRTTVTVTDYDIASLHVDFLMRDTKGKISYRHPKIEIGEQATSWISNEADKEYVNYGIHSFVENTEKVRIQKNDYIEANSFIEL